MRAIVATVSIVLGCAGSPTKACPADEPATCPGSGSAVPSYSNDVAPIFAKYCSANCHGPGGVESNRPLSTYSDVEALIDDVHVQVYDCLMPMAPPDPTTQERITLLTWIVCGSPDN